MRIMYIAPALGRCGGARVIVEHCNRLLDRGHDVFIVSPYFDGRWIDVHVPIVPPALLDQAKYFDVVVATGFQTVRQAVLVPAKRKFYFVQMLEYLFFEGGNRESR
jgi:hypothetical protein